MKTRKPKYLITYYKVDANNYVDEFHMVLENEQTAKKAYNNISSEPDTINVELEVLE